MQQNLAGTGAGAKQGQADTIHKLASCRSQHTSLMVAGSCQRLQMGSQALQLIDCMLSTMLQQSCSKAWDAWLQGF